MEQFWIYVIIGVIYIISRLLKKPEQAGEESGEAPHPPQRRPRQSTQSPGGSPKPLTFEELLREITEGKQAEKVPEQRRQEPEYETLETVAAEEAKSLEEVGFDEAENARIFKAYEDAKRQAFERRSLEETLKLEDTAVDFQRFDVFDDRKKKSLRDDYIQLLRNPRSVRQAVIMSEILKTKF